MKVIHHQYESVKRNGAKLVIDHATGLIWQRSGSISFMTYSEAHGYIELLNREKFAGYSDWRLPTLEEAMSLMEPEKRNGDLYIDPVFDRRQRYIWTADQNTEGVAHVLFNIRIYTFSLRYCNFVRAVRSDYVHKVVPEEPAIPASAEEQQERRILL